MMNRGDVYWISLNPTMGSEINKKRPCVLISASKINEARKTVIVVPLSKSAKSRPPLTTSVFLLDEPVVAACDQLRTVDKSRLGEKVGELSWKDLTEIEECLRRVLVL